MRGASADSQIAVVEHLDAAVQQGAEAGPLGAELFSVAALLDAETALRRVLSDPSRGGETKAALLREVLEGKVAPATADFAGHAVAQRWSTGQDMVDTIERAGVIAQVSAAEQAGQVEELEDELFRFSRVVAGERELREALADRTVPVDRRTELVRSLVADKATEPMVRLAEQSVAGRYRSPGVALEDFLRIVAERQRRLIAIVRVAKQLSETEKNRLAEALSRQYDRPVHLNVVIDGDVLGGLSVEIGDDVIDGTVASRLDEARRRLAG